MPPTIAPTAAPLLTADEFARGHGHEPRVELVDGVVVRYPMGGPEHGYVGTKAALLIGGFVKRHGLGRTMGLDTFILTRRGPDRVRGADLCYLSYARWPRDRPLPNDRLELMPELVVEVRSPSDRIVELTVKAGEYILAGVGVVVVLDPGTASAAVYRGDEFPVRRHNGDELTLPDVLPGFAARVADFFA